ncbi:MAG: 50S ribosomal protein L23 [Gammaproteobacteria bacterium]
MNEQRLATVLVSPHVSEKSTVLSETRNQYVFKVRTDANKTEIRKAVEVMFEVKVESVQVLNVQGKKKRFKATLGKRADWKKAYVRLAEGNTIDLVGAE